MMTDELILHLWDAFVGDATLTARPLNDDDKIAFANAVLNAAKESDARRREKAAPRAPSIEPGVYHWALEVIEGEPHNTLRFTHKDGGQHVFRTEKSSGQGVANEAPPEPAGAEKLTRTGTYVDGEWVGTDWAQAPEPTTADTSPIARIKVDEDGKIIDTTLYAPGLPSGEHDLWPVRVTLTEEDEALMKAAESLKRAADKCDAEHTATIIQRDLYHDIADELAERISKITGVEIGEHSSNNDPWMNAKYAADEYLAAPAGAGVEEFPLPEPTEECAENCGALGCDPGCVKARTEGKV